MLVQMVQCSRTLQRQMGVYDSSSVDLFAGVLITENVNLKNNVFPSPDYYSEVLIAANKLQLTSVFRLRIIISAKLFGAYLSKALISAKLIKYRQILNPNNFRIQYYAIIINIPAICKTDSEETFF